MPAPYQLVCAVQDLHDIYLRLAPSGPYRLPLFGGSAPAQPSIPEPVRQLVQHLDGLVRGAACLLANKLPQAALPVTAELWRGVMQLERRLQPGCSAPRYYAYVTRELAQPGGDAELAAYRLFGEVLAVYLDVLALAGAAPQDEAAAPVRQLRRIIAQTGDKSSPDSGSDLAVLS